MMELRHFPYSPGLAQSTSGVGSLRPAGRMRPAEAFTRPATFFPSSRIDMQQQTAEIILIPRRKPFFVVFAIDPSEKRPEFVGKTFLF